MELPRSRLARHALAAGALATMVMAGCGGSATPSASPSPTAPASDAVDGDAVWPTCEGTRFVVAYPPGWFLHPPTDEVAECSLFAAQEFRAEREAEWGWAGAQIVLGTGSGCRGSFEVAMRSEEVVVDGRTAWRAELRTGEGPNAPEPFAYEYNLSLGPALPCETSEWFTARTESDDPGNFAANRLILDQMMASVRFTDAD
jgi:hypothetical protein